MTDWNTAIQAARVSGDLERYRVELQAATGLEAARAHRLDGAILHRWLGVLARDLRRGPVEREVNQEALRLLKVGRWDFRVLRRRRWVEAQRGWFTRVRVFAAPPEVKP